LGQRCGFMHDVNALLPVQRCHGACTMGTMLAFAVMRILIRGIE